MKKLVCLQEKLLRNGQALEEKYFNEFELSNSGAIKRKPFELYKEKVQKLFKTII